MKILLIGANGQLGTDLAIALQRAGNEVVGATRASLDIRDADQVQSFVADLKPEIVINTAAFHNVELCEDEPEQAMLVNGTAVGRLANICASAGCALLHFSTDFVFDGCKQAPYAETDKPNPQSAYARSKLEGERQIQSALERCFIIRTCGLYGLAGSKSRAGNFVEKILKRAESGAEPQVVSDQIVTPTYTVDLAAAVTRLICTQAYGLYHVTNEGQCSWHEFAQQVLALAGSRVHVKPVRSSDFKVKAKRPAYSVLSKQKLYAAGIPRMPAWHDAVVRYIGSRPTSPSH